jgi:hypothetical protein
MCKKCGANGTKYNPFNLFTGFCAWCYEENYLSLGKRKGKNVS